MFLNQTPVRTCKNYGINNIEINNLIFSGDIQDFNSLEILGDTSNFEISDNIKDEPLKYGVFNNLQDMNVINNSNKKISINQLKSGKLELNFMLNENDKKLLEKIDIKAKSNLKSTVVIKYESNNDLEYFHNGIIKVEAKDNSIIDIVIVNMLNLKSNNFLSIENLVENNAKVNFTIIDLGGNISVTNLYSNIKGNNGEANVNSIYLGTENQTFDLNYISELYGEKSKTNIEVQGALKDNSKKNFKGTIDFKRGCKKAVGNEDEFCMQLSDTAKSKALPMLLCTEEDVEGNHSTACGKINNQELFYIMSRGLSYNDAVRLLVKARFNGVLENVQDENLKQEIIGQIDKRL